MPANNPSVTDLVREIRCGLEIYISGRRDFRYQKTIFILFDDYVELTSKLFLSRNVNGWSDQLPNGRFKNFHAILQDVKDNWADPSTLPRLNSLHDEMSLRRQKRNDLFHSTHLLDMNIYPDQSRRAILGLLDYARLLFEEDWKAVMTGARERRIERIVRIDDRGADGEVALDRVMNRVRQNRRGTIARNEHVVALPSDAHMLQTILAAPADFDSGLNAIVSESECSWG